MLNKNIIFLICTFLLTCVGCSHKLVKNYNLSDIKIDYSKYEEEPRVIGVLNNKILLGLNNEKLTRDKKRNKWILLYDVDTENYSNILDINFDSEFMGIFEDLIFIYNSDSNSIDICDEEGFIKSIALEDFKIYQFSFLNDGLYFTCDNLRSGGNISKLNKIDKDLKIKEIKEFGLSRDKNKFNGDFIGEVGGTGNFLYYQKIRYDNEGMDAGGNSIIYQFDISRNKEREVLALASGDKVLSLKGNGEYLCYNLYSPKKNETVSSFVYSLKKNDKELIKTNRKSDYVKDVYFDGDNIYLELPNEWRLYSGLKFVKRLSSFDIICFKDKLYSVDYKSREILFKGVSYE